MKITFSIFFHFFIEVFSRRGEDGIISLVVS